MIDYEGQVAIVTGAGRGLGRLYALDLARRGAAVVVNDLGGTMRGDGADTGVADQVVDEISKAGGRAVASHHSVDSPEGGQSIVDVAVDTLADWTPSSAMPASSTASRSRRSPPTTGGTCCGCTSTAVSTSASRHSR